jgi:hypothetical protein
MANTHDSRPGSGGGGVNRAARRALLRRLLAALRAEGCTCSPTITPDPSPEPGAREAGLVEHQDGCPLLLRLALAHPSGRYPTLVFAGVRRCER